MVWTSVKDWGAAEVLTADDMDTYVSANTDYLYDYKVTSENWINAGTNVAQLNQRIESGQTSIPTSTGSMGSSVVTFAAAFGTAPRVVTDPNTTAPYLYSCAAVNVGTGQFTVTFWKNSGTVTATVTPYWIAIGA